MRCVALAAALIAVFACATRLDRDPRARPAGAGERELTEALAAPERAGTPLPDETWRALLPPLSPTPTSDAAEGPRFDVAVRDMDARSFFLGLVEDTDVNMVVDPALEGRITLALKQVTLSETLETARAVYGYEYLAIPGGHHIVPPRLAVRVFELNYLNVKRAGSSETRVSSGQVSGSDRSAAVDSGGGSGDGGAVSGSVITTQSDAAVWSGIGRALAEIVGLENGRRVVVNPESGVIVVRGFPSELRAAEDYLSQIERSLARQVILEAKIIEVTLEDRFRSGINWSKLSTFGSDDLRALGSQIGGGTALGSALLSEIAGNPGALDPRLAAPPAPSDTSAFGGVFTLAIEDDSFAAFLELLDQQGEVHVLSSPRISTLNNQKAVIKVGSDEFFVTDVSTTTVTGAATTTSPDIELTPFFSGIALDVTPHVSAEGDITLHIHPSVSEVEDQIKTITIGNDLQMLPLARSDIRETDSVVRARSQQIIVIGGLMQETEIARNAATPWVSKIPLLGSLFKHNLESAVKKELVILLRPVLTSPGVWREEIERSLSNVERFKERFHEAGKP